MARTKTHTPERMGNRLSQIEAALRYGWKSEAFGRSDKTVPDDRQLQG